MLVYITLSLLSKGCPPRVIERQQDNMESNEQDQLLIKADLPEETGQEQDESDLNNLPKWLDEVKADHKIRTNDGDLHHQRQGAQTEQRPTAFYSIFLE